MDKPSCINVQTLDPLTTNHEVGGSNPSRRTRISAGQTPSWVWPVFVFDLPFDLRSVQFRHLANEEVYEIIQVFHNEMLFTPSRIKRSSLPDNVYLYEVQYDDDNIGNPEIIKEHVICNFFGSLLSRQRLKMLENDCILINENSNWTYSGITGITLSEWISG